MKFFINILTFILIVSAADAQNFARSVLPHHAKLQYAGAIGFLSAGIGYENRKQTLEGDLYYGYVPKKLGGVTLHSLSAKFTAHPLKEIQRYDLEIRPLSAGVLVNYTFGKQYFLFSPENYPYNYYGFPTALHAGVFVGGQVSKRFSKRSSKEIGLYYELGTTDKELISYFGNKSIPVSGILNLAIGIKTKF